MALTFGRTFGHVAIALLLFMALAFIEYIVPHSCVSGGVYPPLPCRVMVVAKIIKFNLKDVHLFPNERNSIPIYYWSMTIEYYQEFILYS